MSKLWMIFLFSILIGGHKFSVNFWLMFWILTGILFIMLIQECIKHYKKLK